MTSRRELLTAALAAATLSVARAATPPVRTRKRLIGHTGITWGYSPDNAPDAIRDVGELGFHGFESFGSVLESWQSRGGLAERLAAQRLPLIGAYCPMNLTDPAKRAAEVQKAGRWARLISSYGGSIAVIGPDNLDRKSYDFTAARPNVIAALNEIGRATSEVGVKAAVHPHTGSSIQTGDEVRAVMEGTSARDVHLCPDTGELLAAGVDPLPLIRQFGERIAHVHIKDYDGGSLHDGYTPVGRGRVDVPGIMDALEALPGAFMVMTELNPDAALNRADAATPRRTAQLAKSTFEALGYRFGKEILQLFG
jgi:inosose dehydratase